MEKIKNFRDLIIWQKGIELVEAVYLLAKKFPKEEMYGLSSQLKRAVVSVPSNIAEGFRRRHPKEYQQFLHVALGSLAELETQLVVAERLKFVSKDELDNFLEKIDHISRMTSNLLKRIHDDMRKSQDA